MRFMNEIVQPHRLAKKTQSHAYTGPTGNNSLANSSRVSEPIPLNQTSCYARSFGNPHSRLFWWNGQLFCGLANDQAALILKLEETGTTKKLTEQKLLVDTEPADIIVEGFDLIRHLVPTPRLSYVYEWCPAMWRDATVMIIDLLGEL